MNYFSASSKIGCNTIIIVKSRRIFWKPWKIFCHVLLVCASSHPALDFSRHLRYLKMAGFCVSCGEYKAKKTTLRSNQSTWTISAFGHANVALKKQTNGNEINIHDSSNKYLMSNRVYIVIEPSWRNTRRAHTRDAYVSLEPLDSVCQLN